MESGHHLKFPRERANLFASCEAARTAHSGRISNAATAWDRSRRDAAAVDHRGVRWRCRQSRADRLLHRRLRDLGHPVPAGGRGLSGAPRQHRQGTGRRGDRNPVRLPGRGEPGPRQDQATSRRVDPARSRQVPLRSRIVALRDGARRYLERGQSAGRHHERGDRLDHPHVALFCARQPDGATGCGTAWSLGGRARHQAGLHDRQRLCARL